MLTFPLPTLEYREFIPVIWDSVSKSEFTGAFNLKPSYHGICEQNLTFNTIDLLS